MNNTKVKIKNLFLIQLTSILFIGFISNQTSAYPDFIGYGYSNCITCHYNGLGGGQLNDYGRALFATEIAARDIYSPETEDEEIAAYSGFLITKPLPWWIRPGLKYRGLWRKKDPGSISSNEKIFNMQNDINLALGFTKNQSIMLVSTVSHTELYYQKTNVWFFKDYFLRWQALKKLWLYIGQFEKSFGIRNVDHTAVNRSAIGLGQFDQSQGILINWAEPKYDFSFNIFSGNAAQPNSEKQKGFAVNSEFEVADEVKVGGSLLSSSSELIKWKLAAGSLRMRLSKGASMIGEIGLTEKTTSGKAILGSYSFIESLIPIRRGYNFLSTIEQSKPDLQKNAGINLRWGLGALMFPLPRTEFRCTLVNTKFFSNIGGNKDGWSMMGQFHVSY